jgi:hypothetical protein
VTDLPSRIARPCRLPPSTCASLASSRSTLRATASSSRSPAAAR